MKGSPDRGLSDRKNQSIGWLAAIGFVALVGAISFALDFAQVQAGGSIDLRNRVTGARVLTAGLDPYHYKWTSGEPAIYCDPYNNGLLTVSKTTSSPMLLLLHLPVAALPYRLGEIAWLIAQWLLFGIVLAGWGGRAADRTARWTFLLFALGFTFTAMWRLEIERGQVYLLLTAALSAWLALSLGGRWAQHPLTGFIAGLLATLRPNFLVLLPILALRWPGQISGAAAGLLTGFVLPLFVLPLSWFGYFQGMSEHAGYYTHHYFPDPPPQAFPAQIEGLPIDLLGHYAPIPYADSSLFALVGAFTPATLPASLFLIAFALLYGLWLWRAGRTATPAALLLGAAAWVYLSDFVLPVYRDIYNDVLALNLAGLLASGPVWRDRVLRTGAFVLLGAALLGGWAVALFVPHAAGLITLPSALLAAASLFVLWFGLCRTHARSGLDSSVAPS